MSTNKMEINLLADCPDLVFPLAELWVEEIGKKWDPLVTVLEKAKIFENHLNRNKLPLTYVAHHHEKLIGAASLRLNDGIRDDLKPWLASLVVAPAFRSKGIGEYLVQCIQNHAKSLGYKKLNLFTYNLDLSNWYKNLGWKEIGTDSCSDVPVIVMDIAL